MALTFAAPAAAPLLVETAGVSAAGAGWLVFAGGTASGITTEYGMMGQVTPEGVVLSGGTSAFSALQAARSLSAFEAAASARAAFAAEDSARLASLMSRSGGGSAGRLREAQIVANVGRAVPPVNTVEEAIVTLYQGTSFSQDVAAALKDGHIQINLLGDELFDKAYLLHGGSPKDVASVQGYTLGTMMYLRRERSALLSSVVHEGSHALDALYGVWGTNTFTEEVMAFQRQMDYQKVVGEVPVFRTDHEIEQYVIKHYLGP